MRITANSVIREAKPRKKAGSIRKKALFMDLLSSDAIKWIATTAQNRAGTALLAGGPATPEQADKAIDGAIESLVTELQESVPEAVKRVVAENHEKILERLVSAEGTAVNNPPMGALPPTDPVPMPGQENIQEDIPEDIQVPMAASTRVIDPKLKYAFVGLAQLEPEVDQDTWVIIDGPAGEEAVRGSLVDLNEVESMIDQLDSGQQVSVEGTSLDQYTSNSDSIFYIDVVTGYGASVGQGDDKLPWQVFDEKTAAWTYLNGIASKLSKK